MKPILISKTPVDQMSEKQKQECNAIARLIANDWMQKKEIQDIFKMDERTVRDRISKIAKKVPVIAISDKRGYKRALDSADLSYAKQTFNELKSRIKELEERAAPLEMFIKEISKGQCLEK